MGGEGFVKWVIDGFRYHRIGVQNMDKPSKDKLLEIVENFDPRTIQPLQIDELTKDFESKISDGNFVLMPYPKPEN